MPTKVPVFSIPMVSRADLSAASRASLKKRKKRRQTTAADYGSAEKTATILNQILAANIDALSGGLTIEQLQMQVNEITFIWTGTTTVPFPLRIPWNFPQTPPRGCIPAYLDTYEDTYSDNVLGAFYLRWRYRDGFIELTPRIQVDQSSSLIETDSSGNDYLVDPKKDFYSEWWSADDAVFALAQELNGTGSTSSNVDDETDHPGISRITLAGSAIANGGYTNIHPGRTYYIGTTPTSVRHIFRATFRIGQLSSVTDRFRIHSGLSTSVNGRHDTTNRKWVGFLYSDDINSGKWAFARRSTSGTSDTSTTNFNLTVAANTWYTTIMDFDSTLSSCVATVTDGTTTETQTISTDFPDNASGFNFIPAYCYKTVGTGSTYHEIDSCRLVLPQTVTASAAGLTENVNYRLRTFSFA